MTEIPVTCPHCREEARAPADAAGQTVDCPACGKSFNIPPPASTRSAPLPAPYAPHSATSIPLPSATSQEPITSGMAIAGLAMGYVGIIFGLIASLLLGSFATFMGAVAEQLDKIK